MARQKASSIHLDDLKGPAPEPGGPVWKPIRIHFGIEGFGVNAWTAREAGQAVIERHTETEDSETGHQELYFVSAGRATFTVDDESIEAPAGTLVYVPDPDSVREAVAEEAGTTVLIVGGTPGEAFRPSAWELEDA